MAQRINQFVAQATGLSRRAVDAAIKAGRIELNQRSAQLGDKVAVTDLVTLDKRAITPAVKTQTIMLNKPASYVCSRNGQGSRTIYELLPAKYHRLKPIGRLDKDSSGLLLLTNDGQLANQLTHPSHRKTKVYEVELDQPLNKAAEQTISKTGVELEDGRSQFQLNALDASGLKWQITMTEGRNRQIRRTLVGLGYAVIKLHRTQFGPYKLDSLKSGHITSL